MIRISIIFSLFIGSVVSPTETFGQIGGLGSFQFVDLPSSARAAALGSSIISNRDGDIGLAQMNPSLLDSSSHNQLSISHSFHLAGVSFGAFSYAHHLQGRQWTLGLGARYVNYGEFIRSDEYGNQQGTFSGTESALQLSAAHHIERLTVGVQLSLLSASYDTYGAFGVAVNLAAHYQRPSSTGQWSIMLRNIGTTFNHFSEQRESLQTALLIAYSKRLEHVPFRYYITAHNLERCDIRTSRIDQGGILTSGGLSSGASGFSKGVDNLFRHFIFGGELLIGAREQVQLRFSYDHQRAKELGLTNYRSLSGFNFGFGIQLSAIIIDYAFSRYHLAGGNHQIGVNVDLNRFFSKL